MFPAGQTSASFDITVNDDNILERSETFTIEVDSSSLPSGVSLGGTSQATVAIDNEDCKLQISLYIFFYMFEFVDSSHNIHCCAF